MTLLSVLSSRSPETVIPAKEADAAKARVKAPAVDRPTVASPLMPSTKPVGAREVGRVTVRLKGATAAAI